MSRNASGALLASCVQRPRHQLESAFASMPSIEMRKGRPPPPAGAVPPATPAGGLRPASGRPPPERSGRPVLGTSGRPVLRTGGRRDPPEGAGRAATARAGWDASAYSRRDGRSPIDELPPAVL